MKKITTYERRDERRDLDLEDVREVMRNDLERFISRVFAAGKRGPAGRDSHLYTHPNPDFSRSVVLCFVSCPDDESASDLHARIDHLVTTYLDAKMQIGKRPPQ
ncbi:MAG: hypothetical protein WBX38_17060 [Candidatus Sulfotelmatobacter sp.]